MKKLLLATSILAGTAGIAAAEVTLSGDARMGIVNGYNSDEGKNETVFSSRARVSFTMSGESDSGLSFGASFRADNAGDAASGTAGSVFISGAFGKLSMGDNDSAAQALVGQVDGVGYTGNGDFNEITYMGDSSESVLYTYTAGDLTFAASVGQRNVEVESDDYYDDETENNYSVAVAYKMGDYGFSLGYERGNKIVYSFDEIDDAYDFDLADCDGGTGGGCTWWDEFNIQSHIVAGVDATYGAVTVKARGGLISGESYNEDDVDGGQFALSATYTMDALSLTAFTAGSEVNADDGDYGFRTKRHGLGAAYNLGGGAAAKVGYSEIAHDEIDGSYEWNDHKYEAGLTFSF